MSRFKFRSHIELRYIVDRQQITWCGTGNVWSPY